MRRLRRRRPLLSVVVPAYNVRDYLADCLASILAQSHSELEVVVVDDLLDPSTGDLADRIAGDDSRPGRPPGERRARRRPQRGDPSGHRRLPDLRRQRRPGRRGGVRAARRSPGAQRLGPSRSVRSSGSTRTDLHDAADEGEPRADGARRTPGRCAADAGRRVRLEQGVPTLLLGRPRPVLPGRRPLRGQPTADEGAGRGLPLRRAGRADYRWRVRSDGSSISQQRADPRDLSDRILTKRWSTDLLTGVSPGTRDVWFRRVCRSTCGSTSAPCGVFGRVLVDVARRPPRVLGGRTPVRSSARVCRCANGRVAVAEDQRSDLEEFLAYVDVHPGGLPRRWTGHEVVDHPFRDRPGLPPELLGP